MEKKFKIIMPEQEIKPEYDEQVKRAMFTEDLEKKGILAKVFIFAYLNQPCSVSEVTDKMVEYYKVDFERSLVGRCLKRLADNSLLFKAQSGYVLSLAPNEQKPIHQEILNKFYTFLAKIPLPFRNRYNDVNYYWISNGEGIKFIEWCCKLLKFKCEVEKSGN